MFYIIANEIFCSLRILAKEKSNLKETAKGIFHYFCTFYRLNDK